MGYNMDNFVSGLDQLGVSLSDEQIQQFIIYYETLVEWNKVMNLTSIVEYDEVITKHFLDSLSLVKALDLNQNIDLIDIGTGAGFPGLPLKIAFPNLKVTLLDSLNKRVQFLNCVIEKLNLKGIEAIHGRAEDYAKPNLLREKFDVCVSRAVANMTTLSEYCLPFVKVNGYFISYKSEKLTEELDKALPAISLLGGKVLNQIDFTLPNSDFYRNLLMVKKEKVTPKKYPRKAGLPSKEPIR